ncbi:DUF3892 domain-containing protein [Natrinema thermotolerans]
MTKWGDYAITAVRYNFNDTQIKHVQRKEVDLVNDKLTNTERIPRQNVVADLERGVEYTTAVKNSNGNWDHGDEIHVLNLGGIKYIRTDQNDTKEDNLGGLPTF